MSISPDKQNRIDAALLAFAIVRFLFRDKPAPKKLLIASVLAYAVVGFVSMVPSIPEAYSSPVVSVLTGVLVAAASLVLYRWVMTRGAALYQKL